MVILTYKEVLDNANVPKKIIAPCFSIKKFFQKKKEILPHPFIVLLPCSLQNSLYRYF